MSKHTYLEQIKEATDFLKTRSAVRPKIGLVLGSGLGFLADELEKADAFPYERIPHFPASTVADHAGRLVLGYLHGKAVAVMKGRVHYYEGYTMQEITFPIRVLQALGVEILLITNSCGGLRDDMAAGDLVFIEDHINLITDNPLIGKNFEELGPRFPDLSDAYDRKLLQLGLSVAREQKIKAISGVFTIVSGPCYETRAEIRFLKAIGSDLVGMSTVPEVIVARHSGTRVLGISCVTDIPASGAPMSHEHVVEVAMATQPTFARLILGILERL